MLSERRTKRALFTVMLTICLLAQIAPAQTTKPAQAVPSEPTTQPAPYGDNPAAGKFYQLHGFRMYVEVYGAGEPVLLIHGNRGSIAKFYMNIAALAQHFMVIAADSRSQGKSLDPDHPLTFEMMADDFADLLDAMHIQSANVVGWSDGGINGLLLAIRHPDKVKKLVATGANLWPTADAFRPGFWDEAHRKFEAGRDQTLTSAQEKSDWKLFMLDWTQPHISLDDLHKIRCPSLIICGDHDIISIPHTVLIYQNIPHANLWVVPNCGHATLREHAAEFNDMCIRFLPRHSAIIRILTSPPSPLRQLLILLQCEVHHRQRSRVLRVIHSLTGRIKPSRGHTIELRDARASLIRPGQLAQLFDRVNGIGLAVIWLK